MRLQWPRYVRNVVSEDKRPLLSPLLPPPVIFSTGSFFFSSSIATFSFLLFFFLFFLYIYYLDKFQGFEQIGERWVKGELKVRQRGGDTGEEKKKKKKRVAKKYYSTSRGKVLNVSSLLFIRVLYATSFFFLFPFFWKPETELPICNSVTGNSGFLFNKEKHFTSYILLISPEYGSRGFSSRIFFNM